MTTTTIDPRVAKFNETEREIRKYEAKRLEACKRNIPELREYMERHIAELRATQAANLTARA